MNDHLRKLWAKSDPYHALWRHLLDAAAVSEALLPCFGGISGLSAAWVMYIVALHDIGKADARFVGKAPADLDISGLPHESRGSCTGFRHEARSAEWIQDHLQKQHGWGRLAAVVVAAAVRGHHGDFQADRADRAFYSEDDYPEWKDFYSAMRIGLAAEIAAVLSLDDTTVERWPDASSFGMKLSGIIVLADWIASNPETYDYAGVARSAGEFAAPADYFRMARCEADRAISRLRFNGHAAAAGPDSGSTLRFADVWRDLQPRPTQRALETACLQGIASPGLAIIEAPMGEGKTEAAIYLASTWGRPGAYIALPTQATSNQMYDRYAKFLPADVAPKLVHGMAWLRDEVTPEAVSAIESGDDDEALISREWFANAKRALLAPQAVGTVDQVLMAALNVKHGFLRFLGLTSKTLIIDEVHAYDAYMTTLMETLLAWCRSLRVPVILLSATLSRDQKKRLMDAYCGAGAPESEGPAGEQPYPLLTFGPFDGEPTEVAVAVDATNSRTIEVQRHPGSLGDPEFAARLACDLVKDRGCACVLANTVGSAQNIFRFLLAQKQDENDRLRDTEIFLFHARFRAEERQGIEKEFVSLFGRDAADRRPQRAIVVATQVVEQSLDVDFDALISEIAPIDLLLQRCGRLHRHPPVTRRADAPAQLHVLLPPDGELGVDAFGAIAVRRTKNEWRGVYDWDALLRTAELLNHRARISLPGDFRPLIEACYGDRNPAISTVPAAMLAEAQSMRTERREHSRRNAKTHLIPPPNPLGFDYARAPEAPVGEGEEGERASYFRAQTREGDDSRPALVLRDPDLIVEIRRGATHTDWRPGKDTLRRLFLQRVNLPAWWSVGVVADPGCEPPSEVPKLLRHMTILLMPDGIWRGRTAAGVAIQIVDHSDLGLYRSTGDA